MEELIEFNRNDSIELRYYDQELLIEAQNKVTSPPGEYLDALEKMNRLVRDEGIDKVMKEYNLDAFIAPTGSPARKTDWSTATLTLSAVHHRQPWPVILMSPCRWVMLTAFRLESPSSAGHGASRFLLRLLIPTNRVQNTAGRHSSCRHCRLRLRIDSNPEPEKT